MSIILKKADTSLDNKEFEKELKFYKEKTGFDEVIIGCFLSNFGDKNVCKGNNCLRYYRCSTLDNINKQNKL